MLSKISINYAAKEILEFFKAMSYHKLVLIGTKLKD